MIGLFGRFIRPFFFVGLVSFATLIAGFLVYFSITIMWQENSDTIEKADAIIVLTGGKGRIDAAFDLLLQDKAKKLFISGVNHETTLNDIMAVHVHNRKERQTLLDHYDIVLDYVADTTEANARETKKWIRENNIRSIILVTASYHMPRAALLFRRSLENIDIVIYPVRDERRAVLVTSKEYWILAVREYSKYLGSWLKLRNQEQTRQ